MIKPSRYVHWIISLTHLVGGQLRAHSFSCRR